MSRPTIIGTGASDDCRRVLYRLLLVNHIW